MPRFFLLDPWLANAKGHNYQYALDVGRAAAERGYEVVVATRSPRSAEVRFPEDWQVEGVFPDGECSRHWLGPDGRNEQPTGLDGAWLYPRDASWWGRLRDLPRRWDRRRRIERFGAACDTLFARVRPHGEDVLYLPSVTEFEFLCAARYWRDHPWTREHDWHLQFHFNFYLGRDPDFEQQGDMLRKFQDQFREAADQIPEHRLHFYATSPAIARQFDELGIAIFHPLPYPVRPLRNAGETSERETPEAGAPTEPSRPDPLRVTLPGGLRREKGKKRLAAVVESVWDEWLSTGKFQFVIQAPPRHIERCLPARLRGKEAVSPASTGLLGPEGSSRYPLASAPHPLHADRYDEFIRGSQAGLLIYDAVRYFPRVSGVMCEMLSAGVPVLVPAGCWLADQLAEEHQRHVETLWRRFHSVGQPILEPVRTGVWRFRQPVTTLLARFTWPEDAGPGTYAELVVRSTGNGPEVSRRILSPHEEMGAAVLRFAAPVHEVAVELRSAYERHDWDSGGVQLLPIPWEDGGDLPLARVGLVANDDQDVPNLLRELFRHYEHYRRTAEQFSGVWQAAHSPRHTVEALRSRTQAADALSQLRICG